MITGVSGSTYISPAATPERIKDEFKQIFAANEAQAASATSGPTAASMNTAALAAAQAREEKAQKAKEDASDAERQVFSSENLDRIAARTLKVNAQLSIDSDKESGDYIYRLVDKTNGEVIRQYPAEEILEREKALEATQARLLDEDA